MIKRETFDAISAGYKTALLVPINNRTLNIGKDDILTLSTYDSTEWSLTKRVSAVRIIDDIRKEFDSLNLLKCGYTPFTLYEASPDDLMSRCGIDRRKTKVIAVELKEEPLQRFIAGQSGAMPDCSSYDTALAEIRSGVKVTHWIWYVLPQIKGLTRDRVTEYYALNGYEEAVEYLNHPILGLRIKAITSELMKLKSNDPVSVFGMGDSFKLRASMTLFSIIAPDISLFENAIDKFCMGIKDRSTILMLNNN